MTEDVEVWWQVQSGGMILKNYLADEGTADLAAELAAAREDGSFCVVRVEMRTIRRYQRQVTVTSEDAEAGA